MVVRLRLARHGRKNTPFYHLATINSSKRRDALPLEKLGEYDPIPRPAPTSSSLAHAIEKSFHLASRAPTADELRERREKRVVWDVERVRYWLGVGAQPTESVVKLLERVMDEQRIPQFSSRMAGTKWTTECQRPRSGINEQETGMRWELMVLSEKARSMEGVTRWAPRSRRQ
ncbi:hypothetical protein QFC20_007016 [Naganishia adeliensis]|uniref:Uncharacterized protein n=1 Tax=Naganishia adeliensis TaxID=92952 RepID=A0ACC2V512_9TREE|nr:hypothetical protein QFC20_007016 [Naganishia adeliensis]